MGSQTSVTPTSLLTPENCHSSSRIRAFLRLSRIATDDTIRQHLNETKSSKDCDDYFRLKIVPQWEARSSVIRYCSDYAMNLRRKTSEGKAIENGKVINSEDFDLRLDPYSMKNYNEQLENQFTQCDVIDIWIKNEERIENIVREQTVDVLNDKCYYNNWLQEFRKLAKSI